MAHKEESVDVTLALTLSNLISLVRGPLLLGWERGAGTASQDQDSHGGIQKPRPGLWRLPFWEMCWSCSVP